MNYNEWCNYNIVSDSFKSACETDEQYSLCSSIMKRLDENTAVNKDALVQLITEYKLNLPLATMLIDNIVSPKLSDDPIPYIRSAVEYAKNALPEWFVVDKELFNQYIFGEIAWKIGARELFRDKLGLALRVYCAERYLAYAIHIIKRACKRNKAKRNKLMTELINNTLMVNSDFNSSDFDMLCRDAKISEYSMPNFDWNNTFGDDGVKWWVDELKTNWHLFMEMATCAPYYTWEMVGSLAEDVVFNIENEEDCSNISPILFGCKSGVILADNAEDFEYTLEEDEHKEALKKLIKADYSDEVVLHHGGEKLFIDMVKIYAIDASKLHKRLVKHLTENNDAIALVVQDSYYNTDTWGIKRDAETIRILKSIVNRANKECNKNS